MVLKLILDLIAFCRGPTNQNLQDLPISFDGFTSLQVLGFLSAHKDDGPSTAERSLVVLISENTFLHITYVVAMSSIKKGNDFTHVPQFDWDIFT